MAAQESDSDVVFCHGACPNNGASSPIAGIGIWWGKDDPRNLRERCPGAQTNNRAVLVAVARILETTPISTKTLTIKTNSLDCVKTFQKWIKTWKGNGWKTVEGNPVKNQEVIRYIDAHIAARKRKGQDVVLEHDVRVKEPIGLKVEDRIGINAADALATEGTGMPPLPERDWEALRQELESELVDDLELAMSGLGISS